METGVLGVNHSNQARSGSEEVTPESECHGGPLRRHSSYTSIQLQRKLRCLKKLIQELGTVYDPISQPLGGGCRMTMGSRTAWTHSDLRPV